MIYLIIILLLIGLLICYCSSKIYEKFENETEEEVHISSLGVPNTLNIGSKFCLKRRPEPPLTDGSLSAEEANTYNSLPEIEKQQGKIEDKYYIVDFGEKDTDLPTNIRISNFITNDLFYSNETVDQWLAYKCPGRNQKTDISMGDSVCYKDENGDYHNGVIVDFMYKGILDDEPSSKMSFNHSELSSEIDFINYIDYKSFGEEEFNIYKAEGCI